MSITNTPPSLEGLAAIELWKKGKEEWNTWVEEHPDTPVSFENVDFSHLHIPAHREHRFRKSGKSVHDQSEWLFTIRQNRCS